MISMAPPGDGPRGAARWDRRSQAMINAPGSTGGGRAYMDYRNGYWRITAGLW